MEFAPVYIVVRLFYRIADFFHHWYVDGTRAFLRRAMVILHGMNRTFAVFVTFKHFFEPLYKDYSIPGRVWGVIFRTGRVFLGIIFTLCFFTLFLVVYLIWILLPPLTIYFSVNSIALGTLIVQGFKLLSSLIVGALTIFLKLFRHGY